MERGDTVYWGIIRKDGMSIIPVINKGIYEAESATHKGHSMVFMDGDKTAHVPTNKLRPFQSQAAKDILGEAKIKSDEHLLLKTQYDDIKVNVERSDAERLDFIEKYVVAIGWKEKPDQWCINYMNNRDTNGGYLCSWEGSKLKQVIDEAMFRFGK